MATLTMPHVSSDDSSVAVGVQLERSMPNAGVEVAEILEGVRL